MFKTSPLLLIIILTISPGCTGRVPESFDESFDAGAIFIESTPKVTHRFRLSHRLDRTVIIKDIKRSCTCTAATVAKKTIAPGETVELTMVVESKPIYDIQTVLCTLETDHPTHPEWTYRLSFRSYPHIRFDENAIVLGELPTKAVAGTKSAMVKTAVVEVYEPSKQNPGAPRSFDLYGQPPLIVSVVGKPVIELIENDTVRRSRYPISVDIDRPTDREGPSGTFTGTVRAKTGRGSDATMTVAWSRSTSLEASPSNLSFGLLNRPGDRSSRKVILRSRDDRPFRVLAVVGGSKDIAVGDPAEGSPQGPAAMQHVVELTYCRGPASRRFTTGQAIIRTDHPEMPALRVSWSAIAP